MFKRCVTCQVEKLTTEFRKDSTRKDGLRSDCKECAREYQSKAHVSRYAAAVNKRNLDRRAVKRAFIDEYKRTHPCVKCGESEIACLDFHHPDPTIKEFDIGSNLSCSMKRVEAEVAKCIVVCRNCHAKIHAGILT